MPLTPSAWAGHGHLHGCLERWPGTVPEMCPVSPWLPGGGGPRDRLPQAFPEAHALATGADAEPPAPGGRKHTHAPRQQIKCSLAGRTRGLALLSPEPWGSLASREHSPPARPGSARQLGSHGGGRLARRTQSAVARSSQGPSSLTTRPVCPRLGLLHRGPGPGAGGGQGRWCAESTAQGRGVDTEEGGVRPGDEALQGAVL